MDRVMRLCSQLPLVRLGVHGVMRLGKCVTHRSHPLAYRNARAGDDAHQLVAYRDLPRAIVNFQGAQNVLQIAEPLGPCRVLFHRGSVFLPSAKLVNKI